MLLFSCSIVSDCLQPHGLQHTRLPCPSPFPGACSNSCPLSQWCHPTVSSSIIPFSCLQSFPALGSFFFNWRLITLQYFSGFCHTLTWISHGYTCVLHPEPPTHLPHPIPQGCHSAPALSALFHASNLHWSSILHMVVYMFQCYSLKSSPLSPSEQRRGFDQGKEL